MLRTIVHVHVLLITYVYTAAIYFNRVLASEDKIISFTSPRHMVVISMENAGAFSKKSVPDIA